MPLSGKYGGHTVSPRTEIRKWNLVHVYVWVTLLNQRGNCPITTDGTQQTFEWKCDLRTDYKVKRNTHSSKVSYCKLNRLIPHSHSNICLQQFLKFIFFTLYKFWFSFWRLFFTLFSFWLVGCLCVTWRNAKRGFLTKQQQQQNVGK